MICSSYLALVRSSCYVIPASWHPQQSPRCHPHTPITWKNRSPHLPRKSSLAPWRKIIISMEQMEIMDARNSQSCMCNSLRAVRAPKCTPHVASRGSCQISWIGRGEMFLRPHLFYQIPPNGSWHQNNRGHFSKFHSTLIHANFGGIFASVQTKLHETTTCVQSKNSTGVTDSTQINVQIWPQSLVSDSVTSRSFRWTFWKWSTENGGGFIRIHNFVNIIFDMNWLALQHLLSCPNFIPFLRLKKKLSNQTVGSRFSEGFTYFTDSIQENNGFLNLTSILACFNSKVSLPIEGLWAAIHVIGPHKIIRFDNKTFKKRGNRGNTLWLLWTTGAQIIP